MARQLACLLLAALLAGCASGTGGRDRPLAPSPSPFPMTVAGSSEPAPLRFETYQYEVPINASFGAAGAAFVRSRLALPERPDPFGGALLEATMASDVQTGGRLMVEVDDSARTVAAASQQTTGESLRIELDNGTYADGLVAYFSADGAGSTLVRARVTVYLTLFADEPAPPEFTAGPKPVHL